MIERRLIALHGYSRTGKDAVGQRIVEQGAVRFAKGDTLKDVAEAINPMIARDGSDHMGDRLADIIHHLGREKAKDVYPDYRRFLQEMADRVVDAVGRDVWNEALYEQIDASDHEFIVLTRVCLPIEVEPLHARGGEVWTIQRPGYGPVNDPTTGKPNANEIAMDDYPFDRVIVNDGTLEDLYRKVDEAIEDYGRVPARL